MMNDGLDNDRQWYPLVVATLAQGLLESDREHSPAHVVSARTQLTPGALLWRCVKPK